LPPQRLPEARVAMATEVAKPDGARPDCGGGYFFSTRSISRLRHWSIFS
ncbi:hypothetical protein LCGC14_2706130, partial [marine sediment metagenome]